MSRFHSMCPCCRKVYAKTEDYEGFCSYVCHGHYQGFSANSMRKNKCQICRCNFESLNTRKYCSEKCAEIANTNKTQMTEEKKIRQANQRWLTRTNDETKKRRHVDMDKLKKKLEYERLYGKGSWKHFLKGRKWDRV